MPRKVCYRLLQPLDEALRKELLLNEYLQVDESPLSFFPYLLTHVIASLLLDHPVTTPKWELLISPAMAAEVL